jgi:hypothetical protein
MSRGTKIANFESSGLNAAEVAKAIREELDRSNKYFEFSQGQIEKDRNFYKHLYTLTGAFLTLIFVVAGILSYSSVNQMRTDIKASADAELAAVRAQATAETAQATLAVNDAQATVNRELANVRTEVKNRVDNEFRSENIAALVVSAAKARTEKELAGIIRSETAVQVAEGIKEQDPVIKKTVEDETKVAVKTLEPTIKEAVDKATKEQVKTGVAIAVAPIQSQMATYGDFIRMGTLATLARGNDRKAFDYVFDVAIGNKPDSANPELRQLADTTARAVIAEQESGLTLRRSFNQPQTPAAMTQFLSSTSPLEREAAIDNFPGDNKSILSFLIKLMSSEPNITVLHKAVVRFDALTKQEFHFWETAKIVDWWNKNQASFQ